MITKNDIILLLSELEEQGKRKEEIDSMIAQTISSDSIPLNILKIINKERPLEVVDFYEYIRKSYNKKKSNIYINIVKEIEKPDEVLTTLSALLTQILLFNKKLEKNKTLFLKHSRAEDIAKVLESYFATYDLKQPLKLLKLIKADILALEYINGRREID